MDRLFAVDAALLDIPPQEPFFVHSIPVAQVWRHSREIEMNLDASFLKGKTVIAYIRVSDEDSDPERQRTTIRNWASKQGVEIAMWFEDTVGRNPRDESEKRVQFQ